MVNQFAMLWECRLRRGVDATTSLAFQAELTISG
jgi:hypothetical protein